MIEAITKWFMRWCEKRGRVFRITGTAGPEDVYLIRYYVIKSKYLNVFIHQFLRSDRDDLHDHPWHFMTYLVKGSYTELKYNPTTERIDRTRRINLPRLDHYYARKINRLVFRKATDQHQVVVDRDLKPHEADQAALTICVTGPTIREWGFIRDYSQVKDIKWVDALGRPDKAPRVWIPWRKYLGLPDDTPGRG